MKGILRFPWNWLRIWRYSVFWFPYSFGEAFGYTVKERDGLDHHTLEIELAKQLPQNRLRMVFAGGVAGLAVAIRLVRSSTPHPKRPNTE